MDFIEEYPSALPEDFCQALISQFGHDKKISTQLEGEDHIQKQHFIEVPLNTLENKTLYQHFIRFLAPCIKSYLSEYYQVLLAGTSLNVYHPKTEEVVKLTPENFTEVGLPQIDIIMRDIFRIAPAVMQKTEVDNSVNTCFHSDSFPKDIKTENLHRILTISVFLETVDQGGEIVFSEFQRQVSPVKGKVVIFPAYFTHTYRQNRVVSNNRYQVNTWLMFNRSESIYRKRD